MKLKICGMKNPENILEAGKLLPEFMGFIFWEKSPRYLTGVIPKLPESINKVGVFVNETINIIHSKIQQHDLQFVQLHGDESVAYCEHLFQKNIKIIKVFSIGNDFDFNLLKPFEPFVDYFLFDTKGKMPGGNGFTFNWKILQYYQSKKPFFLSGGIGIDEIVNIKKLKMLPFAIDINSKFETEPGIKDIPSILEFQTQLKAE